MKRWYVVQAFSGYEKHVMRSLQEKVELAGMEEKFGQILVPTEEVVEIRDGKKRKSERKFYPGYVMVEMEMEDESWHLVKNVSRVLGFIGGTADKPRPLSQAEADEIAEAPEGEGGIEMSSPGGAEKGGGKDSGDVSSDLLKTSQLEAEIAEVS